MLLIYKEALGELQTCDCTCTLAPITMQEMKKKVKKERETDTLGCIDKNRPFDEIDNYQKYGLVSSCPHHEALLPGMSWNNGLVLVCSIDVTSLGAPTSAEHFQTSFYSPTI